MKIASIIVSDGCPRGLYVQPSHMTVFYYDQGNNVGSEENPNFDGRVCVRIAVPLVYVEDAMNISCWRTTLFCVL